MKQKVLILCTGNSCRSQMAEGLINAHLGDHFQAFSAGTRPSGYVHPQAIAVMAELGIDLSRNRSKSTDTFQGDYFDYVITVCDSAHEDCPVWLNESGLRKHIGFDDPAKATGTEEEILAEFRRIRDEIADQVLKFLGEQVNGREVGPMSSAKMRLKFTQDLQALKDDLLRMGSMVDSAIQRSMHALKYRDINLAREIIAGDAQINDLRFEIEEKCFKLIAQQQPMASDLRTIIAVMNIILDLERMGDHAAGIAKIVVQMGEQPLLKPLIDLPRMTETCQEMLRLSLDAFLAEDGKLAQSVIEQDETVDTLYTQVFRELLTFMIEDPKTITRAMSLLFVGHNLERTADHVTNICERILFLNTGRMEEIESSGDSNIVLE